MPAFPGDSWVSTDAASSFVGDTGVGEDADSGEDLSDIELLLLLIVCFLLFEESRLSELLVSEPELLSEVELVVDEVDMKDTGKPVLVAVDEE